MNRTQSVIHATHPYAAPLLVLALLALGLGKTALAQENGCWVDFWEFPNYLGAQLRIEGPIQLGTLRDVKGESWDQRFDSLQVGPKAQVTLYENINFKLTLTEIAKYPDLMKALGITEKEVRQESEIKFDANTKFHHLGEVNFHRKTRSLKIDCVK